MLHRCRFTTISLSLSLSFWFQDRTYLLTYLLHPNSLSDPDLGVTVVALVSQVEERVFESHTT